MKTLMPQEVETFYIIPAIKRELTKGMVKRDLKQNEIAQKLGIAESAVSQYLKSKRGAEVRFDKKILREIDKSVKSILKKGKVIEEIDRICRIYRKSLKLCEIHKCQCDVPEGCRICLND